MAESKPAQPAAGADRPPLDACTLVSAEEVRQIQGAPVSNTAPGSRSQPGATVTQCFYTLPSAADSLNLVVFRKTADAKADERPVAAWNELFHEQRPVKIDRHGKEKLPPSPFKIEGIGDEAFWTGGQFGGTLHVRKGDDTFQLSVGGPGDETAKLEKLKLLAAKITERL